VIDVHGEPCPVFAVYLVARGWLQLTTGRPWSDPNTIEAMGGLSRIRSPLAAGVPEIARRTHIVLTS
jgi:hypothetical protein